MTTSLPPEDEQTYNNALAALLSSLHQSQTPEEIKKAAQRRTRTPSDMRRYLSRISLPHDSNLHCKNIVHITGTKGKGSTAAICESVLRNRDGLTTGTFTSPHLVDIRERIRIDGKPVSKEVFGQAYWEIRRRFEQWKQGSGRSATCTSINDLDEDGLPYLPGYFRMLTLMAVFIFAHYELDNGKRIDAVILEVGVGGRYDATNIFDHSNTNSVCGVTLIDYDHTRVLGSSLLQIAWEKGGIFHSEKGTVVDVFSKDFDDTQHGTTSRPSENTRSIDSLEVPDNVLSPADETTRFFTIDSNESEVVSILRSCAKNEGSGQALGIVERGHAVQNDWKIGLPGDHQRINAELAVALCNALTNNIQGFSRPTPSPTQPSLEEALEQAFWPGRCQSVAVPYNAGRTINVRCDGAHTAQSLASGLEWFRAVSGHDDGLRRPRFLIFNCSHERNPVPLLDMIQSINQPRNAIESGDERKIHKPLFDQVYFCRADSERPSALEKGSARELLKDAGRDTAEEEIEALGNVKERETEGKTWQETLANIWMELAARKGVVSLLEVPCVANVSVSDAIDVIKHSIEYDPMNKFKLNGANGGGEIEVFVTGSLYMVGSALSSIQWNETSSGGSLKF